MALPVPFPRCAGTGTISVVPAAWIAFPPGCQDPNQYLIAWRRGTRAATAGPADRTPPPGMNQHPPPFPLEKGKSTQRCAAEPWPLTSDPSVWWPIDYVWPSLGNCCLAIVSRVWVLCNADFETAPTLFGVWINASAGKCRLQLLEPRRMDLERFVSYKRSSSWPFLGYRIFCTVRQFDYRAHL